MKRYILDISFNINWFILILDQIGDLYNSTDKDPQIMKDIFNLRKIISSLFISLFNGNKNINIINKLQDELKLRNITEINFDQDVNLIKVNYYIEIDNDKVLLVYLIRYIINNKEKIGRIYRYIPLNLYSKLYIHNEFKYMMFFYIIIGYDTGHFWGLPPKFYKLIESKYNNPIECFASPFNNNLTNYYSLFNNLDSVYGSKGNFFTEFLHANNDLYVINPPFIEDIIYNTMDLISEKMNKSDKTNCIIYMPQWDDILLSWLKSLPNTIFKLLEKTNSIVYNYSQNRSYKSSCNTYLIYCNNYHINENHILLLNNLYSYMSA